MKKIEASKLNRSLKEVLEGVAKGDRYELTRYGKVVAKIVPPNAKEGKSSFTVVPSSVPEGMTVLSGTPSAESMREAREALAKVKAEPSPEQIRQKRRDALLKMINRTPKT
jgi:prevent-host-death family protein